MYEELPVYDVEELSVEEALHLLASQNESWGQELEFAYDACVLA